MSTSAFKDCKFISSWPPFYTVNEHDEVVAAQKARIAEIEKRVADMTAERLRKAGAYYVVPKEALDAKDARIAELEARKPDDTARQLEIGQYQHEIAALKKENAELKHLRSCEGVVLTGRIKDLEATLHETRDAMANANVKEKRLLCEEGKYDKCGVGGISVDGATKAAKLAESMLDDSRSLSYAAACLLVLSRELEATKHKFNDIHRKTKAEAQDLIKVAVKEMDRTLAKYCENW